MTVTLRQLVKATGEEFDFAQHPFFVALDDGSMTLSQFIETQRQFYHAVNYFSRPMAIVAARFPNTAQRVELMRNVWEEHGEGDISLSHGSTFIEFLRRLGDQREMAEPGEAVTMFNTTLIGLCSQEPYWIGLAALGMIEQLFSGLSGVIGRNIVQQGWMSESELIHYNLHEVLDMRHAEDFFVALDPIWSDDDQRHAEIKQGLRLGAYCFYHLYSGLYLGASSSLNRR